MKIFIAILSLYCTCLFGQWENLKIPREALVNDIIYAGNRICVGSSEGLFINRFEEDHQLFWDELSVEFTNKDIQACCATNTMLIAATNRSIHVASLSDFVWQHIPNAIDADQINEFALDYHLNIYAATSNGLWYSEDHGLHWIQLALKNIPLLSVMVMPDQTCYVVGSDEIHYGAIYYGYLKDSNPKLILANYTNVLKLFPSFQKEEVLVGSSSLRPDNYHVNLLTGWGQPVKKILGLQQASISSFQFGKDLSLFAGIRNRGARLGIADLKGIYYCHSISSPFVMDEWVAFNEGMIDTSVECMFKTADYLFIGTEHSIYRRKLDDLTMTAKFNHSSQKIIYHGFTNQLELAEELVGKPIQLFTSDGKLVCSFTRPEKFVKLSMILKPGVYYCASSQSGRNNSVSVVIH